MSTSTVRVSRKIQTILHELAARENASMQAVLERAVEQYRDKVFFEEVNQAYAALKADPQAWREEVEERRAWDNTLGDDLERA